MKKYQNKNSIPIEVLEVMANGDFVIQNSDGSTTTMPASDFNALHDEVVSVKKTPVEKEKKEIHVEKKKKEVPVKKNESTIKTVLNKLTLTKKRK